MKIISEMNIIKQSTKTKFSTVDVLAPISMKNAAKCDKQCELQTVSHQNFERNLRLHLWGHACFSVSLITRPNQIVKKRVSASSLVFYECS